MVMANPRQAENLGGKKERLIELMCGGWLVGTILKCRTAAWHWSWWKES